MRLLVASLTIILSFCAVSAAAQPYDAVVAGVDEAGCRITPINPRDLLQ